MKAKPAEILAEYGPFPGVDAVAGLTWANDRVWFASGDRLNALDPDSGEVTRSIAVPAHAGTAFDGRHLYQIAEDRIQRIDPETGTSSRQSPPPAAAATAAWPGPRERCGSANIAPARSIRSIPRTAGCCAHSPPTASSPGSPGRTANCGTPPGRTNRANCAASTLLRAR